MWGKCLASVPSMLLAPSCPIPLLGDGGDRSLVKPSWQLTCFSTDAACWQGRHSAVTFPSRGVHASSGPEADFATLEPCAAEGPLAVSNLYNFTRAVAAGRQQSATVKFYTGGRNQSDDKS